MINKESNFKDETVSSIPLGNNNFIIKNNDNIDLRRDEISNIKPMLSGQSNIINIPDGKKVKIRPSLKKVPSNTFSMIANAKKNRDDESDDMSNDQSVDNSYTSNGSYHSESDDILSNNNSKYNTNNDDDESNDDYS